MKSIRVGVAGLGGFAAEHHAALASIQSHGICQVVATCDPFVDFDRTESGLSVYPTLSEMLGNEKLDLVTLPTPIPLHVEQHRLVVTSGAACYLEKPPTLWWPQFQQMLQAEEQARVPTQVGFNFVIDPLRQRLRHRIRQGEFGQILSIGVANFWPRNAGYYGRNNWAGRVSVDGQMVLDSPLGNACAHYVQNALFWLADQEVTAVQASRWRAHPIETWDTVFLSARMTNGVPIQIAMTHCGNSQSWEREFIELENARITFDGWQNARIEWSDGRVETLKSEFPDGRAILVANLVLYCLIAGLDQDESLKSENEDYEEDIPPTTLAKSANFVAINTLAHLGAAVREFPHFIESDGHRTVEGLEDTLVPFARDGVVPEFVGELPKPVYRGVLGTLN